MKNLPGRKLGIEYRKHWLGCVLSNSKLELKGASRRPAKCDEQQSATTRFAPRCIAVNTTAPLLN